MRSRWNDSYSRRGTTSIRYTPRNPIDIEQEADIRANKLAASPLHKLYIDNWRIVLCGNTLVGFSPNPSVSVILTPYAANKVMTQQYNYLTADKQRLAMMPLSLYYPTKGREGIDYFSLDNPSSVTSLFWYAAYSSSTFSQEMVVRLCQHEINPGNVHHYLTPVLTKGYINTRESEEIIFWPSTIWQYVDNPDVMIKTTGFDIDEIMNKTVRGTSRLTDVVSSWLKEASTGNHEVMSLIDHRE
jgi:hypothetical protein